jgi:hypothetical protein
MHSERQPETMMSVFTLFTLSGPLLGAIGIGFGSSLLLWVGVALAAANLFLNLASGSMRFPVLPILFATAGALVLPPWWAGAAVGLLVYTAIEGLSEVLPLRRR